MFNDIINIDIDWAHQNYEDISQNLIELIENDSNNFDLNNVLLYLLNCLEIEIYDFKTPSDCINQFKMIGFDIGCLFNEFDKTIFDHVIKYVWFYFKFDHTNDVQTIDVHQLNLFNNSSLYAVEIQLFPDFYSHVPNQQIPETKQEFLQFLSVFNRRTDIFTQQHLEMKEIVLNNNNKRSDFFDQKIFARISALIPQFHKLTDLIINGTHLQEIRKSNEKIFKRLHNDCVNLQNEWEFIAKFDQNIQKIDFFLKEMENVISDYKNLAESLKITLNDDNVRDDMLTNWIM
eukprot:TRINITY_DN1245_c0_g1_i1.p1 TRINITY_DN1245_c0_g1~~TRINITY_DN1245_c0_g1_i1.p1  ORF type:complete len:289 (+),score=60.62 TRINITY_DN1245_c0_g1_i1:26-892(+)